MWLISLASLLAATVFQFVDGTDFWSCALKNDKSFTTSESKFAMKGTDFDFIVQSKFCFSSFRIVRTNI